jgi:hypothetical protein
LIRRQVWICHIFPAPPQANNLHGQLPLTWQCICYNWWTILTHNRHIRIHSWYWTLWICTNFIQCNFAMITFRSFLVDFFLFVFYIKDHIIREQRQFCFSSDSVYFLFLFLVLFCLTGLPTCCWERVVKRGFEKEAVEKYFHWGRWISECRTRFTLLSWIHSVIVSSSTWIRNIGNRSRTP